MRIRTHEVRQAERHERSADRLRRATRPTGRVLVGSATDPAEREADRVADAVLAGRTADVSADRVVRRSTSGAGGAFDAGPGVARALASSAGRGASLPAGLRSAAERSLGADLSSVRVHRDQRSSFLARSLSARAFTSGNDVHVGADAPALDSAAGQRLLAHEVGHVAQHHRGASADVLRRWPSLTKKKPEPPVRRVTFSPVEAEGRKKVLKAQAGPGARVRFVKVSIAGSGDQFWKTDQGAVKAGALVPSTKFSMISDGNTADNPSAYRKKMEPDGPEVVFSGPGGGDTRKSVLGGVRDSGSNKIKELVAHVPRVVDQLIAQERANDPTCKIIVLIRGHSRGAVAAAQIVQVVAKNQKHDVDVTVEVVLFDPVMGPSQSKGLTKTDMSRLTGDPGGGNLPMIANATLVYAVKSGYTALHSFTPERVYGAKRIVITTAGHHANIARGGFVYRGKSYTGSGLGSLPEGVFVQTRDGKELRKVGDMTEARLKLGKAYERSSALAADWNRKKIIKKVLQDYYAKAS